MDKKGYIGVDLGGTSIKLGICDESGTLLQKYEGLTEANQGQDRIIDNMVDYVKEIASKAGFSWEEIVGVGIGIPGFLDIKNGWIKLAPNLGMRNVPVKKILEERFHKTVVINNDANVAALGEAWSGAGAGLDNVVCFTLGTGVGCGIIIGGKIYEGSGTAGELGHISVVPDLEAIPCGCGQRGCLETVSSATGIIKMAKDAVARGELPALAELDTIMAKDVFEAAKSGDESAVRIVRRAALYLGKAMAAVEVILDPQLFIVGGGVARAGDILFEPVREAYQQFSPDALLDDTRIVPAQLGNDAGIVGAAGLLLRA